MKTTLTTTNESKGNLEELNQKIFSKLEEIKLRTKAEYPEVKKFLSEISNINIDLHLRNKSKQKEDNDNTKLSRAIYAFVKDSSEDVLKIDINVVIRSIELDSFKLIKPHQYEDLIKKFEKELENFLSIIKQWEEKGATAVLKLFLSLGSENQTFMDYQGKRLFEALDYKEDLFKPLANETAQQYGLKTTLSKREVTWDFRIYIPGAFFKGSDVGRLIWYLSEAFESVPGVEVELLRIERGSLNIFSRINFKDSRAVQGFKELLKDFKNFFNENKEEYSTKGLNSFEAVIEKPSVELENMKKEGNLLDKQGYRLKEQRDLEIEAQQLANMKAKLEIIKQASEFAKEGMLPYGDVELLLNEIPFLKKKNGEFDNSIPLDFGEIERNDPSTSSDLG